MKRKGFTLIELLVAIACSTIVLSTVTASFYFINKVSNEVIVNSTNNIKARTIRDYILDQHVIDQNSISIVDNQILHGDVVITKTNAVDSITISSKGNLYVCEIIYNTSGGKENLTFSYK